MEEMLVRCQSVDTFSSHKSYSTVSFLVVGLDGAF